MIYVPLGPYGASANMVVDPCPGWLGRPGVPMGFICCMPWSPLMLGANSIELYNIGMGENSSICSSSSSNINCNINVYESTWSSVQVVCDAFAVAPHFDAASADVMPSKWVPDNMARDKTATDTRATDKMAKDRQNNTYSTGRYGGNPPRPPNLPASSKVWSGVKCWLGWGLLGWL